MSSPNLLLQNIGIRKGMIGHLDNSYHSLLSVDALAEIEQRAGQVAGAYNTTIDKIYDAIGFDPHDFHEYKFEKKEHADLVKDAVIGMLGNYDVTSASYKAQDMSKGSLGHKIKAVGMAAFIFGTAMGGAYGIYHGTDLLKKTSPQNLPYGGVYIGGPHRIIIPLNNVILFGNGDPTHPWPNQKAPFGSMTDHLLPDAMDAKANTQHLINDNVASLQPATGNHDNAQQAPQNVSIQPLSLGKGPGRP